MYTIDIKKLDNKIFERRTTKDAVAKACEINRSTLYRRLRNGTLTVGDIHAIIEFLSLSTDEIMEIFFSQEVA